MSELDTLTVATSRYVRSLQFRLMVDNIFKSDPLVDFYTDRCSACGGKSRLFVFQPSHYQCEKCVSNKVAEALLRDD